MYAKNELPLWQQFEAFWMAYPRKIGKSDAWAAWRKLKCRVEERCEGITKEEMTMTGTLPQNFTQRLIKALTTHKKSQEWKLDGGRFVPAPSKWLHEERFADVSESGGYKPHPVLERLKKFEAEKLPKDKMRKRAAEARKILEKKWGKGF